MEQQDNRINVNISVGNKYTENYCTINEQYSISISINEKDFSDERVDKLIEQSEIIKEKIIEKLPSFKLGDERVPSQQNDINNINNNNDFDDEQARLEAKLNQLI